MNSCCSEVSGSAHDAGAATAGQATREVWKTSLDPADIRQLLDYDQETGALTWRPRRREAFSRYQDWKRWVNLFAGRVAGSNSGALGYRQVFIFRRNYKAHRVAWAIHYGEWPDGQIDHINGDTGDNRIENLRVVTNAENQRNSKHRANNSSGRIGVHWCAKGEKWAATIAGGGRRVSLGLFVDFDAACAARAEAEREFGFHPNHGRRA